MIDQERASYHIRLFFLQQYRTAGDLALLVEGIQRKKELLAIYPPGDPERLHILQIISTALSLRFEMFGDLASLQEGIDLGKEALTLSIQGHEGHRRQIHQMLSTALCLRGESGDLYWLQQGIAHGQQALDLCPLEHPDRARTLLQLSAMLCLRGQKTSDIDSLVAGVSMARDAVLICPLGDSDRPQALHGLGVALSKEVELTEEMPKLNESIELLQEALVLCNPHHAIRGQILNDMALVLVQHYERSQIMDSFWRAISHVMDLANQTTSSATSRMRIIMSCLKPIQALIGSQGPHILLWGLIRACEAATQLLYRIANSELNPADYLSHLAVSVGVRAIAAAAALRLDNIQKVVEVIEETNAIFWSRAQRSRATLDDLPTDDANKLQELFRALDRGGEHTTVRSSAQIARLRRTSEQVEQFIDTLRQRPGLERFLGCSFSVLVQVAEKGPVVVLLSLGTEYEAIVIFDPIRTPKRVPLPKLSSYDMGELSQWVSSNSFK